MEYTAGKLSKLAGISARTLRYYDEIGLLHPERISNSGYRIYGQKQVQELQQILFFKELGVELDQIAKIVKDPNFDRLQSLKAHREALMEKRESLTKLIQNLDKTIDAMKGETTMTDQERFEGFKKEQLAKNEEQYGKEIRQKYGDEAVNASNEKFLSIGQTEHEEAEKQQELLRQAIVRALQNGIAADSKEGNTIAELHKNWLMHYWPSYTKEAHKGLAAMYLADPRFSAYYDAWHEGATQFLHDAIQAYCK